MRYTAAALSLTLALLTACGGAGTPAPGTGGGGGSGELVIHATDAPFAHGIVQDARVRVTEIRAHNEDSGAWLTLHSGIGLELDLLHLNNGITQLLVQATVPVGTYRQLRLIFSSGRLELVNGNVYSTDLGNLQFTSQSTSGQKVFVDPPIDVVNGVSKYILLDFDLAKTFKPVPGNDALGATRYKLHPVIKGTNLGESGEIRGVVTEDLGSGPVGVGAATVYILPPGETDPANSITSTGTASDGSYAVIGLLPGTYDVLAEMGVKNGSVTGRSVARATATVVDIFIQ